MILGAFGMDYYWVNTCTNEKPLRYSDFNIDEKVRDNADALKERADWIGTDKERLNKYIAENCDGIVTGLYEYQVCYEMFFPQKTKYIPFPIRLEQSELTETQRLIPDKLKLFIGISKGRSEYKGTDIMLKAAQKLVEKYILLLGVQNAIN